MALLIYEGGREEQIRPTHGKFTNSMLTALIDCEEVRSLPLNGGRTMYADNHGKRDKRGVNYMATKIIREVTQDRQQVRGPVVIANGHEVK